MSALALPVDMGLEQWQTVVDRVTGLEEFKFYSYIDPSDDRAIYEMKEGCKEEVGRLVTRAKKSSLIDIKSPNLSQFCDGIAKGLTEEGGICEEIMFYWHKISKDEIQIEWEEIKKLANSIGWEIKGEFEREEYYFVKIIK